MAHKDLVENREKLVLWVHVVHVALTVTQGQKEIQGVKDLVERNMFVLIKYIKEKVGQKEG